MDQMNSHEAVIRIAQYLNRFTLIVGEVNTGKTTLTKRILDSYCLRAEGRAAVVDLAPSIPPLYAKGDRSGIGGTLNVSQPDRVRYFHCPIHAPRLLGKSEREMLTLADENASRIEPLFEQALTGKINALFINDCSLYLHAGKVEKLITWIRSVETAVVNAYYGSTLGPGLLSAGEREKMEHLMRRCDRVIHLKGGRE
jgi:hypothetical protein